MKEVNQLHINLVLHKRSLFNF